MSDGVLKYGAGSKIGPLSGNKNFIGAGLNGLSLSCTPIEILSNDGMDTVLATATGFFWNHKGRPFLITNWHVISGQNIFTRKLGDMGFIPKRIRFYAMSFSTSGGIVSFIRRRWTLSFDDMMVEHLSNPLSVSGEPVDIYGIPIASGIVFGKDPSRTGFEKAGNATCFVNEYAGKPIISNAGDDCFILGYPLQNYDGLMPPIWKRGSIASETSIGVDGRPVFLIDAATTSGMSGSPIFRKAITLTVDNRDIGAIQELSHFELIGIYAGRLENKYLEAVNLGYGWYKTLIDEVLNQMDWSLPTFSLS